VRPTESAVSYMEREMQGATKTTIKYSATEARAKISDILDAAYFGERVVITKRDRKVAVVSMEFLDRVDKLLEAEAELEAEAAKAALSEFQQKGGKTMEELERELDVD